MTNLIANSTGFGDGGLLLTYVAIGDRSGNSITSSPFGETLRITLEARADRLVRKPNLGFALNSPSGELVYSISTFNLGVSLADIESGQSCRSSFDVEMTLRPGEYWLTVIAADLFEAVSGDSGSHHDTHERLVRLDILPNEASARFDGAGRVAMTVSQSPAARYS